MISRVLWWSAKQVQMKLRYDWRTNFLFGLTVVFNRPRVASSFHFENTYEGFFSAAYAFKPVFIDSDHVRDQSSVFRGWYCGQLGGIESVSVFQIHKLNIILGRRWPGSETDPEVRQVATAKNHSRKPLEQLNKNLTWESQSSEQCQVIFLAINVFVSHTNFQIWLTAKSHPLLRKNTSRVLARKVPVTRLD